MIDQRRRTGRTLIAGFNIAEGGRILCTDHESLIAGIYDFSMHLWLRWGVG